MVQGRRSALLAALAAAAMLALAGPASAATCRLVKYAGFDLSKGPRGVVTIQVKIDGQPEHFLVDTGGVTSSLSQSVVKALKLEPHRINPDLEFYAADGHRLKDYVHVARIDIGPVFVKDVEMLEQPSDLTTGINAFEGTLAPDFLRNFDVDFDFGHHTLNLFSPKHCKGRVVYWAPTYGTVGFKLDGGHMETTVTLDGHEFTALIDTGASDTSLSSQMARAYFDLEPGAPGMEPIPGAGPNAVLRYWHRFGSLKIGDVEVKNPKILIRSDALRRAFRRHHNDKVDYDPIYGTHIQTTALVLGLDVLTKLHLYLAYGEDTLYVTAAGGSAPDATAQATAGTAAH